MARKKTEAPMAQIEPPQCKQCYEDYVMPPDGGDGFCTDFCMKQYDQQLEGLDDDEDVV